MSAALLSSASHLVSLKADSQVEDRAIPIYIIFTYDEILDSLEQNGKRDLQALSLERRSPDIEDRKIPIYIIFTYDEILEDINDRLDAKVKN